ncbi:methyl-accepting chemotaxis protein [Brevibacillus dissolubilis]|uniref:methyl-accepting chemotaxis protein n=1 Tax=Brevibacillus dissolubilis TaxID=1844116 RepID=UPI0021003A36|nr:methyl-accepting chemotaxis protein [Brevibacillus dissolubilis]
MKRLFKPGIFVLNKLRFAQKFSLMGGILFLPILLLTFLIISQINEEIDALSARQIGFQNVSMMKGLLKDVQQHRAASSSYLNGDKSYASKMTEIQAKIQEDLKKIDQNYQEHGAEWSTKPDWDKLKREWEPVVNGIEQKTSATAIAEHTAYIASILELMTKTGDATKLFLSKELKNYYVITGVVETLPNLTENLGQLRIHGSTVLEGKAATPEQERTLSNLYSTTVMVLQTLDHEMSISQGHSAELDEAYQTARKQIDSYLEVVDKELIQTSTYQMDAKQYFDLTTVTMDTALVLFDAEQKFITDAVAGQIEENEAGRTNIRLISFGAIFLALYGFISFFYSVTNSVRKFQEASALVADGDLTISITLDTRDEMTGIAASFNTIITTLRDLIVQLGKNSEQLATSAEELTASAEQTGKATEQITEIVQEVAVGTDQQVLSSSESNRAVHEMSNGVQDIAENAQKVSHTAVQASEAAEEGHTSISLAVKQMNHIHATINELSTVIKGLGVRSQEIGQIVDTITSIASQTNLLALNAAIEAARAGEHGKGFAVVADEVRKLAEESSLASRQIGELIQAIQVETTTAVQSMETGTKEVVAGIEVVNQAGRSFEQIHLSVHEVASQIQEVSTAADQLSAGTDQVVKASEHIMKVTEEISAGTLTISSGAEEQLASMEEITASSLALSRMAEELQETISKFKV